MHSSKVSGAVCDVGRSHGSRLNTSQRAGVLNRSVPLFCRSASACPFNFGKSEAIAPRSIVPACGKRQVTCTGLVVANPKVVPSQDSYWEASDGRPQRGREEHASATMVVLASAAATARGRHCCLHEARREAWVRGSRTGRGDVRDSGDPVQEFASFRNLGPQTPAEGSH